MAMKGAVSSEERLAVVGERVASCDALHPKGEEIDYSTLGGQFSSHNTFSYPVTFATSRLDFVFL